MGGFVSSKPTQNRSTSTRAGKVRAAHSPSNDAKPKRSVLLWCELESCDFPEKPLTSDDELSEFDWVRWVLASSFPVEDYLLPTELFPGGCEAVDGVTNQSDLHDNSTFGNASRRWLDLPVDAPKAFKHRTVKVDRAKLAMGLTEDPALILVASRSRNDPIGSVVKHLGDRFPNSPTRLVLGDWWSGHQRTMPIRLPEVSSYYWHQLADALFPDILNGFAEHEGFQGFAASQKDVGDATALQLPSIRVDRDAFGARDATSCKPAALIVSESSSTRRLWIEHLSLQGYFAIAIDFEAKLPDGDFGLVIADSDRALLPGVLDRLRRVYTSAFIAVLDGFPRWNEAREMLRAGADVVQSKPYRASGLFRTFSSAALARR